MFQIPLPVAQLVLSAFNHVVRQQPAMQLALQAHAGQVVRIRVLPPVAAGPGSTPSAPGRQQRPPAHAAAHGVAGAGSSPARPLTVSAVPQAPHAPASASPGSRTLQDGATNSRFPVLESDARIGADGALSAIPADHPAVVLTVCPNVDVLFEVLRKGPQALGATLRIEGNVMLASALGDVARALHWDVEEDLSRVVGDVAAHRIGGFVRDARQQLGDAGLRLHELLGDHLASDRGVLAARADLDDFAAMLRRLDIRITLLERDLGVG